MHKIHGGMSFKDLTAFNLDMLGKQGWKFQTEPNSLVSRIFKARYFPSQTYLIANIGHNPSYVWRSITCSRFLVCGGSRWSIGTGIPILNASWLLNGSRIDGNMEGAHFVQDFAVNILLEENSKRWNEHLIRQVFSQDIASSILNMPPVT